MKQITDTMPIWLQAILKTILGALSGASIGLVWGGLAGCLWVLNTPLPHNRAAGDTEGFGLFGLIFTVAASMVVGGCIGFVAGAITALILHVRNGRRAFWRQ